MHIFSTSPNQSHIKNNFESSDSQNVFEKSNMVFRQYLKNIQHANTQALAIDYHHFSLILIFSGQ